MTARKLGFLQLVLVGVAATMAFIVTSRPASQPPAGEASSHREAPMILEDPLADNTDVYAFVSTEPGRSDFVTIISNWIPGEEPGFGPNFFVFSEDVLYSINVDVDGDALADLTFNFDFETTIVNGNTFLYNTGPIGLPPNPADPSSQYTNLNIQQSYTATLAQRGGAGGAFLLNARTAPDHVGPRSTPNYPALAAAAVHTVSERGMRVFAGQREEGFYVDVAGVSDLLNVRNPGVDTLSGFNVHSIAIEVPKTLFQQAGDTDGRIGVWATSSRPSTRVLGTAGAPASESGPLVQVSRLANPLVNEVLIPLVAKDLFNATSPDGDARFREFIVNPGTSQGPLALVPLLNTLTGCTPVTGRTDLETILLLGIPGGLLPGFPGNRKTQTATPVPADLLRLNYNIPPSAQPNPLGLLGGDPAGFPNGRRVSDDVTDIDVRAAAGAVLHLLGQINCPASLTLSDNVNANDAPYLTFFPYLAIPHQGYSHDHRHGGAAVPDGGGGALPPSMPPPPPPAAGGSGGASCIGGPCPPSLTPPAPARGGSGGASCIGGPCPPSPLSPPAGGGDSCRGVSCIR